MYEFIIIWYCFQEIIIYNEDSIMLLSIYVSLDKALQHAHVRIGALLSSLYE